MGEGPASRRPGVLGGGAVSFTVRFDQPVMITVPASRVTGGYLAGRNGVWISDETEGLVVGPAPMEEPTGFGARVRGTYMGRRRVAVLADPGDGLAWRLHDPEGCYWVAWSELKDPELLDAGETE